MSLQDLNEYALRHIFQYLDYQELFNLRETSESFYNIGKLLYLDTFSKENKYLKTYGNFSFKTNSHFDISKSTLEIIADLSKDGEFLVTFVVQDQNLLKSSSVLMNVVFQDAVYEDSFENLIVLNIDKGHRLLDILKKFPNFLNLKINFQKDYQEKDDTSDYSSIPKIQNLAISNIAPHALAEAITNLKKLELWNTFDKFLIQQNCETLEELTIDHLSCAGPVNFQDTVVLDFKIKSKLKVFNALGVRCLECSEFLENQPDAKLNFYMCFFVNGNMDY